MHFSRSHTRPQGLLLQRREYVCLVASVESSSLQPRGLSVCLSVGFSRQESWSGLPCPPLGGLPDTGMESTSLMSPALAGRFFTTSATWEAQSSEMTVSSQVIWSQMKTQKGCKNEHTVATRSSSCCRYCCCCRVSRVRLCATPETAAHQAPPSLGFSRQEHWSGLPLPSPMHESEK